MIHTWNILTNARIQDEGHGKLLEVSRNTCVEAKGGGWWPRCSLYLMVIFFVIQNIYHIHIVCEQHNLIYERFLLSTAQKVYTTWVTVNKHGGSTPRGKKWSTCVSSWHDLFLVCALCIRLLWKLCKWS